MGENACNNVYRTWQRLLFHGDQDKVSVLGLIRDPVRNVSWMNYDAKQWFRSNLAKSFVRRELIIDGCVRRTGALGQ